MSKLSDNEILDKITEKREQWDRKNTEQLYKLQAKREGYYEAITDVRQIVIDKELEKDKEKKDIDELYNAYSKSMKDNDKYIDTIRLMAKTFIDEIDLDKYYKKYNNMTEEDLIDYFLKEVEKSE